jgi:hypothetical protein
MESTLEGFGVGDLAESTVLRADGSYEIPGVKLDLSGVHFSKVKAAGVFGVECFDRDGNLRWVDSAKNAVTNAALDDVLNVYIRGVTPTTTWYIGLVDNAGFTTFAAADTMPSHSGWSENTQYTGTRQSWSPGASSGQSITNASALNYAMTPTVGVPATIRGLFLCSDTSASTSGVKLFATAAFTGGNQVVNNGDTLKVTYTLAASTS